MTDDSNGGAATPSATDDGGGASGLGRREFLLGSGTLGALALGGTGAYLSSRPDDDASYLLQQGYLRYEVTALSKGDLTVEEFYDYTGTSAAPHGDVVADDDASRMFVYDGPVGASLVFLHGSRDVDHGGTAAFSFSGLSRSQGEWAVRDDPTSVSDDFTPWENGNQRVRWEWGANTTDGGAFWGGLGRDDFTIKVAPKTLRGVDAWRFLSGDLGDLDRYDLSREKPVKLKPAKGRTVKRANVEIMPDSDENAFDPYANDRLTVAVKRPPADADPDAWVAPSDLDPGNYSVNFGSKRYLAGQNAAQPQTYFARDGTLYLEYKTKAAHFSLDSAYGYLVTKLDDQTYVRGRDIVRPGGFDNADEDAAQLVVSDLHVAPDSGDLTDEYVAFANDGDDALDISGYTIRDEAGWEFHVDTDVVLGPGARVRLHTGAGEWTDTDLYWDAGEPVWDDDGDTVIVLDADGNTVLRYSYPRR